MQDYQNSDEPMKIPHPRLIEIDYVRKQMVIKGIFSSLSFSATKLQIDEYRIPSDFSILSRLACCYLKLQMKIRRKKEEKQMTEMPICRREGIPEKNTLSLYINCHV